MGVPASVCSTFFLFMVILMMRQSNPTEASSKLGLAWVSLSPAGTMAPSPAAADFLDAHNRARADVGVGPMDWSPSLAVLASRFVRLQRNYNHCSLSQSPTKTPYGENQCWGKGWRMSPREAVETWVAQKAFYDYATNSCMSGKGQCGGYTQVVWRNSVRLGCAQASCDAGDITLTVCYYDPPGNFAGEKPY